MLLIIVVVVVVIFWQADVTAIATSIATIGRPCVRARLSVPTLPAISDLRSRKKKQIKILIEMKKIICPYNVYFTTSRYYIDILIGRGGGEPSMNPREESGKICKNPVGI